ncbi:MAG TPA: S9 family peptidase [Acidobacteriaceae bacterium]|nr:S9 family peptidase [Acidobacteriaceae bacterium]
MPLRTVLTALLALPLTLPAPAQPPAAIPAPTPATEARISSLLDSLARVRIPQTVAISPDGTLLAWSVDGPSGMELHLTGIAPKDSVQDAAWDRILSPDTIGDVTNLRPGRCTAAHPAWSPDGRQLAFLSNCSDTNHPGAFTPTSQQNLFLWTLATNRMAQISHLKGEISDLQWSPDGQSIAFLFVENATRRAGALDAMDPRTGVIGQDHIEVQRAAAVDPATTHFDWLTSANLHIFEFAWSPDSRQLTYIAADPPGENNWWTARLYAQSIVYQANGHLRDAEHTPDRLDSVPQLLFDPATAPGPLHGLQIAVPRFSPDGKHIAFIGGLMSDQGAVGGDIYLISATPSPDKPAGPIDLTPNRPASPAWLTWLDDGSLGVTERAGGSTHLTELDLHTSPTGQITATDNPAVNLTLPATIISGFDIFSVSTSHTDNIALIEGSFSHPPEIYAGPLDHLQQITHLNDALKPSWGRAQSVEYTHDGRRIQGWLLYPAHYDPARKYPLIVSVHGGPSSAVTPRWPTDSYSPAPFSSLGYFVFLPNPRGSFGQGEAFTQANRKDFGYGDLSDILAGLDVLEKTLPIDPARIGITGWSYGGFMSMFAPTQTNRFHAAVAGAGISDWLSYYGENSIDQWMVPFFGASVYDSPAVYARASAINFVKQAHTPTLLLVGDRDGECPAPQSFEYWHALRDLGVPTQLVVYPNEGHHFNSPDHQRDALARTLSWFETYMPPSQ